MIKKLFNGQITSISTAALLVALSSLVSRLLGVFRDRILAGEFGAGDTLDIYYAAFRVPDLIFNLLILGALSAGFIPLFTKLLGDEKELKNKHEVWSFTSNIINILGLALIALSVLAIIFSEPIMRLFAPGFDAEKLQSTVMLSRIMFLSPLFLGLSGIFGGVLQSFKRFFVYSLAPIMYNIGIIVGALYLVPIYGIYGLAWGVVLGALMHLLIQLPSIFSLGFRYEFKLNIRNQNILTVGRMMIPRTLSLAIAQINLLVSTAIASTLAVGSLAVFNFANNLQSFPIGIFGISFATAVFPTLSAQVNDKPKMINSFSWTLRQILFFIIPATVLFLVLRAQIVRVILGTGLFNWEDTILTIRTLGYFSLSLFAQASIPLLVRMFYAKQNSKKPFYIGLVSVLCDIILSLWLSKYLGVAGIALAFSIANVINFTLLWIFLRKEMGNLDEWKILVSVAKFFVGGIFCGITSQLAKTIVWPFVDMSKLWGIFTQGAIAGLSGLAVYLIICGLFKSEELSSFWNGFKRRLPWKKIQVGDQGEARGI
ncbi:MAG: putative peptidoglycan lipid II flippase MurJ [Parcubacteria group bacterium GW2011_GWE2_38_18]|nr:MAG: putative peptidoglycan lipid II flippase MurJ [Parcubacteria group bacterium GW2011_GWE2_38_18]